MVNVEYEIQKQTDYEGNGIRYGAESSNCLACAEPDQYLH